MEKDALFKALHDHMVGELLLRDEPLGADDDLFDAGFDSMSLTRMLVFIEERYGVTIPDEEVVVEDIATLNALTSFVARHIANK